MPSRGTKALELFIDALREDYDWLVGDLEEALKNPEEVLEEEQDVVDSVNLENVSRDYCKKIDWPKIRLLIKNPQFQSNYYETW